MNKELRLYFGVIAGPFLKQIEEQGFSCRNKEELNSLYLFSDQALRMLFAGLITEGEIDKIRRRIVNKVKKLVEIGETK